MSVQEMIKSGEIIEVDGNYMADYGDVFIRCYSRGTSAYWVLASDIRQVYRSLFDAYNGSYPKDLFTMRMQTQRELISYIKGYAKENNMEIKKIDSERYGYTYKVA